MKIADLPTKIPLYAANGTILFPRAHLPLILHKKHEKAMVDFALQTSKRYIGIVQSNPDGGHFQKGCLGRIVNFHEGDPLYVALEGLCRFHVQKIHENTSFQEANVTYKGYEKDLESTPDPFVNRPRLLTLLKEYLEDQDILANWEEINHASDDLILSSLSMLCPFKPIEKQALLEVSTLSERCDMMIALMEMASPQLKDRPYSLH